MSDKITFDQIKVGDRIKTREVFKEGSVVEQEFTVKYKDHTYAGTDYTNVYFYRSYRAELTITRVAAPEPKKIGTVVEYMHNDDLETAVLYSAEAGNHYPWIRSSGHALKWEEILARDPNPKIKEN